MVRLVPLLLMLLVAIPAAITTPVLADSRDHFRADDDPGYDDRDDDDGSADLYVRHGDSDDEDDDDDDDYGANGPDDEIEQDDPSDGMRT